MPLEYLLEKPLIHLPMNQKYKPQQYIYFMFWEQTRELIAHSQALP